MALSSSKKDFLLKQKYYEDKEQLLSWYHNNKYIKCFVFNIQHDYDF